MAIAAAVIVLVLVVYIALRGGGNGHFAGKEDVNSVVRLSQKMDAANFETVNVTADKMGDWLLTKGFDGYSVPDELAGIAVSGCALAKNEVTPVAVLVLDGGARRAAVFPSAGTEIYLPEDGSWQVYELPGAQGQPDLAVAATAGKGVCFVVSGRESTAQLGTWLRDRKTAPR